MKIYIYSLYDRKTGELLAKGTAKELARQHWYNSTDSVYQAYLTQKKRAGNLHGCSNCRIEREALEKPKKAPPKKAAAPKKPEPPKIKGIPDPTPLQWDVHALLAYNAEARRRGRPELSYGHWAAAGKPTVPEGHESPSGAFKEGPGLRSKCRTEVREGPGVPVW